MLSAICFNLDQSKILSSVNGLNIGQLSLCPSTILPHNSFVCQTKGDPSREKGPYENCKKYHPCVSLCNLRRLTRVKTFRYWQIFCVLSENSI